MASSQCDKPANDTCQQKCNSNSRDHSSGLAEKAADMASGLTGKNHTTTDAHCHNDGQGQHHLHHATSKTETHCSYSHANHTSTGGHGLAKPTGQTHCLGNASHSHGHKATSGGIAAGCNGNTKKKGEHKKKNKDKGLVQKIKDRVSGNSSSSDSDSDNEGCHKRKN